jgi:hypothetical protein
MKALAMATVALAALISFGAADISGTWQADINTQIGVLKYVYNFKVDGDKITGTAEADIQGEKQKVELKDIKLAGDDISFTEPFSMMGNTITITYKGKVSGDEMKLTRQVGEFATEDLVAKRVR